MEVKDFFEKVDASLRETKGNDPIGVDFFIQDIEELIEKWREEDNHVRKL